MHALCDENDFSKQSKGGPDIRENLFFFNINTLVFLSYKKKCIRELGSKGENLKEMLRQSQSISSRVNLFYMPEIDVSSFIASSFTRTETALQ